MALVVSVHPHCYSFETCGGDFEMGFATEVFLADCTVHGDGRGGADVGLGVVEAGEGVGERIGGCEVGVGEVGGGVACECTVGLDVGGVGVRGIAEGEGEVWEGVCWAGGLVRGFGGGWRVYLLVGSRSERERPWN